MTNNYALYAVETLLFFGSVGSVETFAYQVSWFDDACFPAYAHRGTAAKREGAAAAAAAAGAPAVEVGCRDASAVVVNGVYYGSACVPRTAKRGSANPPCGKMALIPEPSGCGTVWQNASVDGHRPRRGDDGWCAAQLARRATPFWTRRPAAGAKAGGGKAGGGGIDGSMPEELLASRLEKDDSLGARRGGGGGGVRRAGAAAAGGGNASAAEVGQLRAELASATSMVSAMASRVAELEKLLEAKLGGLRK